MRWYYLFDIENKDHMKYLDKLLSELLSKTIKNEIKWEYDCSNGLIIETYKTNEIIVNSICMNFILNRIYIKYKDDHVYNLSCKGYKGIAALDVFTKPLFKFNNKQCALVTAPASILPKLETLFNQVANKAKYTPTDYNDFYTNILSAFCSKEGD